MAAEIAGVTDEELYELNPAFHRWATDPSGPHYLLLPVDGAQVFTQNVSQLSEDQRMHAQTYTVGRGDSVASVAKRFNTTVNVVREMNDLPSGPLTVGSDLQVPASVRPRCPRKCCWRPPASTAMTARRARPHVHVVRRGDTMWSIARRTGMDVNKLAMMNGMQPGDPLRAGQRLRLSNSDVARPCVGRVTQGDLHRPRAATRSRRLPSCSRCSVKEIMSWNGIGSRSGIAPGQKLTIRMASRRG